MQSQTAPLSRSLFERDHSVALLLLVAGSIGAVMGTIFGTSSVLLFPAQIIAGVIPDYPQSPMGAIYRSTASLGTQVVALLSHLGMTPIRLANGINMLIGALYCQAFAVMTYAYCRNFVVSLVTSSSILFVAGYSVVAAYLTGADYPINIFSPESYGILGFGLALLSLALLGVEWIGGAIVLTGVTFAMHPVLGAWVVGTALCALPGIGAALGWRRLRAAWVWLLVPLPLMTASAAFTLGMRAVIPLPPADPVYLATVLGSWDAHRAITMGVLHVEILARAALITACLAIALRTLKENTGRRALTLLLLVQSCLGVVLYLTYHWAPDLFPDTAKLAIPSRFLNVPIAVGVPVCVGLLLGRRPGVLAVMTVGGVVAAGAFAVLMRLSGLTVEVFLAAELAAFVVVIVVLALPRPAFDEPLGKRFHLLSHLSTRVGQWRGRTAVLLLVAATLFGVALWRPTAIETTFSKKTVVTLRNVIENVDGTIVVAPIEPTLNLPIYFPSRTPYLLDVESLDYLAYVPQVGPRVAGILADIYGIDFFNPPPEVRHLGGLEFGVGREVWENRSRTEWEGLGRKYRIYLVAAPSSWKIDLPIVFNNGFVSVYGI
ncbi:MAG: hypothetical protein H7840_08310 [Alphaproteobacteria bacterium]